MRRGDVFTVSGGGCFAGKPRPAVIIQGEVFDATDSVTICALTTDETDAPLFRPVIEPGGNNGLQRPSRLMGDKVTTVPRSELGTRIGRLDDVDIRRLDRAILVFLGL